MAERGVISAGNDGGLTLFRGSGGFFSGKVSSSSWLRTVVLSYLVFMQQHL